MNLLMEGVKKKSLSLVNLNSLAEWSYSWTRYTTFEMALLQQAWILSYLNVCIKHNHSLLKMGKKQTSHIHQSNCVGTFSTKMPRMKDWTANGSSDSHESW